jgi:transcriptional regulator with XRE-family HTH domain
MSNLGERLKNLRKEAGLNQSDIAKAIGFPQSTYSYAEREAFPSLEIINKVCEHIGMELWEFFITKKDIEKQFDIPYEYLLFIKSFLQLPSHSREILLGSFKNTLLAFKEQEQAMSESKVDSA